MVQWLNDLFLQKNGPLSRELKQVPSALSQGQSLPETKIAEKTVPLICGYCSTGCQLSAHVKNDEAVHLSPSSEYPVNTGMACPKGWDSLTPLRSADRGVIPLYRDHHSDDFKKVPWEKALNIFCNEFKRIKETYGPGSLAYISTGQIPTEEMALLGAVAKFGMGVLHGDGNTRQCMATAATAYKQAFGFDSPPFTYKDFELSDTIVLIGSNLCIAHPILWDRVKRNPHRPKIIVIDPRRTETAQQATHHYAVKPKGDLWFFYAIARLILEKGAVDIEFIKNHTRDYEAFSDFLLSLDFKDIEAKTGFSLQEINLLAELILSGKKVSFWWTMGVNQSYEGVRLAQAIINIAMMTGNIGKPGTGANSITGQCNAMGSRIFSNTTALFGGRDFLNPDHRAEVAEILDIPEKVIPRVNSYAYDQIIDAVDRGEIKGLWIIATNTAHSWIHQNNVRAVLNKLEFLVVQDIYPDTETAQMANLYLPAAAWGEKEGSFINSERRFGAIHVIKKKPGDAKSDFDIFNQLAETWGCDSLFKEWKSPADAFQILKKLSRGRPCDITGIKDYDDLDDKGGIQWPWPEGAENYRKERRLFEDGRFFHADGKARFIFANPGSSAEEPSAEYPFILLSGRGSSAQWHTQTKTGRSGVLKKLYSQDPYVEIHPADGQKLNLTHGDWIRVKTKRGQASMKVMITSGVSPGQIFIPMHYEVSNRLTLSEFDPHSRQPSYKYCAAALQKIS